MIDTPKGTILLLDDDKFLSDMYGIKFSAAGFSVHTSLSTEDALKALREGLKPDDSVFDLVMPNHDGFSFLQSLISEHLVQGAVLVALTNQGDDAEKTKAESLGVDRYIVKASMIPSEVVSAVQEEMAKKSAK